MAKAILICTSLTKNPNSPPYIILEKDITTIGRSSTVDIKLDTSRGKEVSKLHTRISRKSNGSTETSWIIEDNNSLNGTFVNARKIRSLELNSYDEIVFGGGPKFLIGERVLTTDLAECRYVFYKIPQTVHYRADINMTHTNTSFCGDGTLKNDSYSDLCPICYLPISGVQSLPCGHSFCFTCLQEWGHTCAKRMQPCVCPMCRKEFSYSEINSQEYTLTQSELKISYIEPLLNTLGVDCCKDVRVNNIFTPWDDKMKDWFHDSYQKVKSKQVRKITFLDLTKANLKYILKANSRQLSVAIANLGGKPKETKEDQLLEVLSLVFKKFSTIPESRKLRSSVSSNITYWNRI